MSAGWEVTVSLHVHKSADVEAPAGRGGLESGSPEISGIKQRISRKQDISRKKGYLEESLLVGVGERVSFDMSLI